MFDSLTERLSRSLSAITGKARLTDENIQETLREVRMALLEADVALPVVKQFIDQVRLRAVGQEVTASLSPGQVFVRIVNEELVHIMGDESNGLSLATQPPAVVLMAGLQGVGKTTTVAKLAHWLKERQKKSVMVASTDVYRPAAIDQLRTLAQQADVAFFDSDPSEKPADIARKAVDAAKRQFADVLIVDTAGRLHVDGEMMDEIRELHRLIKPVE
ncbi:MAG TPA: signal recognition particle receptor subunit alpha, partial [Pseudomonadales bacterium]|nr:signal recognition particle receptor subunit alpha [Pseudomonadales bacterium]